MRVYCSDPSILIHSIPPTLEDDAQQVCDLPQQLLTAVG
jgi:hypothetical protein